MTVAEATRKAGPGAVTGALAGEGGSGEGGPGEGGRSPRPPVAPFDALAAGYDASFTDNPLGRRMRAAVERRLAARFTAGGRVLDLGCGTGEDAVRLARRGVEVVAVDASAAMVTAARAKVAAAGMGERVTVRRLEVEALVGSAGGGTSPAGALAGSFDGAYSNFGALNCVADLAAVAAGLARLVRPGGAVVLCVMGPLAPWDWLVGLARLRPSLAVRRLRPGGARWRGTIVRYPSPGRLRRAFAPWFAAERLAAVGALLPPPSLGAWAARHPRLVDRLDRWERRGETRRPLPWLADHYLLELVRR